MLIDTDTRFVRGIFLAQHIVETPAVDPVDEQDLDGGNNAVNQSHAEVPHQTIEYVVNAIHSVHARNHGENVTEDNQENVSPLVFYGVGKFFSISIAFFKFLSVNFHTSCVLRGLNTICSGL